MTERCLQALASSEFAIDPSDPHFGRIKQPEKILEAIAVQRKTKTGQDSIPAKKQSGSSDLKAMVGSLKRKGMAAKDNNAFKKAKSWS